MGSIVSFSNGQVILSLSQCSHPYRGGNSNHALAAARCSVWRLLKVAEDTQPS